MGNLVNEVLKVFNDFAKQEMGNRLSTYSWGAFMNIIIPMIKNYEPAKDKLVKTEVVKDVKKKSK